MKGSVIVTEYYHPLAGFAYFASMMVLAMLLFDPLLIGTGVLFALLLNLTLGGLKHLRGQLKFGLPMFVLVALFNPLVSHGGKTVLFELLGRPITLESTVFGLCSSGMLLEIFLWFGVYNLVVTPEKFLSLFSRFAPSASMLLTMTQRMVPLFLRRLRMIRTSQKTLLGDMTQGTPREKIKNGLRINTILLSWSMEDGLDTADSMKARGYGSAKRTLYSPRRFKPADAAAMILILFLFLVCSSGAFLSPKITIYPAISRPSGGVTGAVSAAAFFCLGTLPFIAQIAEVISWRFSK